jgi:hypothetical protein
MRDDSQIAGSIATHHEERLQRRELQIPPVGRDDKGRVVAYLKGCDWDVRDRICATDNARPDEMVTKGGKRR